ncbi:ATP-dependent helicase HrpA [Taylorella asinigenitalis 14/45]|uniref:ATP-dependent helicase HrpA n=1 Tax=Taylorella asinigenitalis 14/45 TaxID=1091495 RepID=I7JMT2_9BURK|nr:ATP-dependent RNA helicase HrpA [Taylorella asinigenitalis]CCG19764.1 ATP-dependent helicase HrpA [Taylorella asinigenitalis 14/45]
MLNSPQDIVLNGIKFNSSLPVNQKLKELSELIKKHQVVIVSGETGSGKTTQLPKLCLAMGRGTKGLIGHTQPRRIAAISVAKRISEELGPSWINEVAYQVRFQDKSSADTKVKLMTDGILLAETQSDRLLKKYDTIIIDEAHERSLNIDFLLGLLKSILPKRPNLKVIITSATIDAVKFSEHFKSSSGVPAPVIEVSGRLYPVEIRYRPLESERPLEDGNDPANDKDKEPLEDGIVRAVDECTREGGGDILVFLPGEREIREASDALFDAVNRRQIERLEVLPLFSRLSQNDQERIFKPTTSARRVILATNVAETSITVPGIRFVVDSGLARVKRYSWRNKVEQLHIEKISRASANQRAGRCGRVASGVCIRLYDEEDFLRRPEFTDPEILRSSLASVILQMKSLRIGDVAAFPFLESPTSRAIADGYQILHELGAISGQQNEKTYLTRVGMSLAQLPLDPKIARIILAGRQNNCLKEILIIASALSVADPRERPYDQKNKSDQLHAKFKDEKSEFMSFLKLWQWYWDLHANKISNRKFNDELKKNMVSPLRMREWIDIHNQLLTIVKERKWTVLESEATYEQIHKSLLTGLLGNIGTKSETDPNFYQGTRNVKFLIHPLSGMQKKAGRWVMAAELVETSKIYARVVAQIDPRWVEGIATHILQKNWSDPRWDFKRGQVVANERATLYGLQIYQGRKVHYGRINPDHAREIFIREALVPGDMQARIPFVEHNLNLIKEIEHMEHKSRRKDILVDDALIYEFYASKIPQDISQTASLEAWHKKLNEAERKSLFLIKEDLMQHSAEGVSTEYFPKKLMYSGVELSASYHFEPGSPKDGVTVTVPDYALSQINQETTQWLVPGMLKEKVQLLAKTLPQKIRRHLVPIPEYAREFYLAHEAQLKDPKKDLIDAIIDHAWQSRKVRIAREDFKSENLPAHMHMIFKVVDSYGRMLSAGRNLAQLKAEHADQSLHSFQKLAQKNMSQTNMDTDSQIVDWSFGVLPEIMEIRKYRESLVGYPALVDEGTHCSIDVYDTPEMAMQVHFKGVLRLFYIGLNEQIKYWKKNIPNIDRLGLMFMNLGTQAELIDQIIEAALRQSAMAEALPQDKEQFEARKIQAKEKLGLIINEISILLEQILDLYKQLEKKMQGLKVFFAKGAKNSDAKLIEEAYIDIKQNLEFLVSNDFLMRHPFKALQQIPRYLKSAIARTDKLLRDINRDSKNLNEIRNFQNKINKKLSELRGQPDPKLNDFIWMLQELRVALFSQELKTPYPVSAKRLEKAWTQINN